MFLLLHVVTDRLELVTPSHVEPAPVFGSALYPVKAVLSGRVKDVAELVDSNFVKS